MNGPSLPRRLLARLRAAHLGMRSEQSVTCGSLPKNSLAANAEPLQNHLVTLWVRIAQVSQKPATLGNQGQQPLAGAVVFLVRLEVRLKQRQALAQQGNLYFWRPRIGFVALIRGKNLPLGLCRQCHSKGSCSLSSLNLVWLRP